MPISSAVAIVLALAWADLAAPISHAPAGYAVLAMLAGQSILLMAQWCFTRRYLVQLRAGACQTRHVSVVVKRMQQRLQWFSTLGGLALLIGLDWCHLVRAWAWSHAVPLADDLLVVLPVLVPLLIGWSFCFDIHDLLPAVHGPEAMPVASNRLHFVITELRRQLALLLIPLGLMLALQDGASLALPGLLDGAQAGAFWLAAGALLFLIFPLTLRVALSTERLPTGPLRDRLERLISLAGAHLTDIRVLNTRGGAANAAVAGPLRALRYVFLTDSLLARLSDDEIEAVFAHELGHVRHRHLALRLAVGFAPCATWLAARDWLLAQAAAFPVARIEPGEAVRAALGADPLDWCALGLIALATACGFIWCSRRWEHEADLFACRLLDRRLRTLDRDAAAADGYARFAAALERLAAVNGHATARNGWQHASLERRVEFLRRVTVCPGFAARFRRRTLLVGSLLVGLAAGGFLAIGWNIIRQYATSP